MSEEVKVPKNARRRGWHTRRRLNRRADAERRQAAFDALTTAQKLKKLEDAGHGHCAEAQKYVVALGEIPAPKKKTKSRKRDRKKGK